MPLASSNCPSDRQLEKTVFNLYCSFANKNWHLSPVGVLCFRTRFAGTTGSLVEEGIDVTTCSNNLTGQCCPCSLNRLRQLETGASSSGSKTWPRSWAFLCTLLLLLFIILLSSSSSSSIIGDYYYYYLFIFIFDLPAKLVYYYYYYCSNIVVQYIGTDSTYH